MGDRCYLVMKIAAKDKAKANAVLGGRGLDDYFCLDGNEDDAILEYFAEEANYAYCDDLEAWAQAGLIFMGQHSVGDDYDASFFCAIDDKIFYAVADLHLEGPVCRIDWKTAEPDAEQISKIKEFLSARARVEAYFKQYTREHLFGQNRKEDTDA